jgi:hypothetical protein
MFHERRIVPLDGSPHVGEGIRQWNGDLRGRWEGDTLVVETKNFSDRWQDDRFTAVWRAPSATLHLVERFTRLDGETMLYRATVTDPDRFTSPWTVETYLTTNQAARGVTTGPLYEYACHEGNYGAQNILSGARAAEKSGQTESRQHIQSNVLVCDRLIIQLVGPMCDGARCVSTTKSYKVALNTLCVAMPFLV